jgi:hypothetical protein
MPRARVSNLLPATAVAAGTDAEAATAAEDEAADMGAPRADVATAAAVAAVEAVAAVAAVVVAGGLQAFEFAEA